MRCSDYFTKCFINKRVKLPKIYFQRSKLKQKENKSSLSVVNSLFFIERVKNDGIYDGKQKETNKLLVFLI